MLVCYMCHINHILLSVEIGYSQIYLCFYCIRHDDNGHAKIPYVFIVFMPLACFFSSSYLIYMSIIVICSVCCQRMIELNQCFDTLIYHISLSLSHSDLHICGQSNKRTHKYAELLYPLTYKHVLKKGKIQILVLLKNMKVAQHCS